MLAELVPLLDALELWTVIPYAGWRREPVAAVLQYEQADGCSARRPDAAAFASLSDNAIDRNVFAEAWMLEAGAVHLRRHETLKALVSHDGATLNGVLPVVMPPRALPLRIAQTWSHAHCFEATPLVREGGSDAFFDDLFAWLGRSGVHVLKWPRFGLDGGVADALFAYLRRTGRDVRVCADHERPTLEADGGCPDAYMTRHLTAKRRREIGRCRRRLSELGQLEFRTLEGAVESDWWAREFLRLEATGWKGETGARTALACRPDERAHFRQTVAEAARRGQLLAHSLELDGRPVAMTINYRAGNAVWAYKTAYDAALAKFSPGVLVEIEGTRGMMTDPTIQWVDSCSDGDNALIEELWRGRRRVGDLLIAVAPGRSFALTGTRALAGVHRWARRIAKAACRSVAANRGIRKYL